MYIQEAHPTDEGHFTNYYVEIDTHKYDIRSWRNKNHLFDFWKVLDFGNCFLIKSLSEWTFECNTILLKQYVVSPLAGSNQPFGTTVHDQLLYLQTSRRYATWYSNRT